MSNISCHNNENDENMGALMMVEANRQGSGMETYDMFSQKRIRPMQMTTITDAFDSKEYFFELMQNGIRCIAYLDEDGTELRSARNMRMLPLFPELSDLHLAAMKRCVVDGFVVPNEEDMPPVLAVQSRMRITLPYEIQKAAREWPAKLVAYDILYWDGDDVTGYGYRKRRAILRDALNDRKDITISHAVETMGIAFHSLAEQNGWDGILAKRKDGLYHTGTHPMDWLYIPVRR